MSEVFIGSTLCGAIFQCLYNKQFHIVIKFGKKNVDAKVFNHSLNMRAFNKSGYTFSLLNLSQCISMVHSLDHTINFCDGIKIEVFSTY